MNGCAGPGITADPRRPVFDGKRPEATQLNPVSTFQGSRDLIKHSAYDTFHLPVNEMRMPFREPLY